MTVEVVPPEEVNVNGRSVKVTRIEGFDESEMARSLKMKLIPQEELGALGDFLRRRGYKIAFTTGVWDLKHIGHERYAELARSLGDVLVVGINTDGSVKRLKGQYRPILDDMKRAESMSYLDCVNYMTLFGEDTGAETIRVLKPDSYLCVEGSWDGDIATKQEVIAMGEIGGSVFYTPRQGPTVSTSAIIEKISMQAVEQVALELPGLVARNLKF